MTAQTENQHSMSGRGWAFLFIALATFLLAGFAMSGIIMAGSFSAANVEQITHWRRVAVFYEILLLVAVLALFTATYGLVRQRRRERPTIRSQAV